MRPKYMMRHSTICEGADRLAVIPVDKPTVAKAESTSKDT